MNITEARATPLMGQPTSWSGYSRAPLEEVPDGVLRQARSFFKRVDEPNERTKAQVRAIDLVLADREANNPQQSLAL
jgi:hypothetical protein